MTLGAEVAAINTLASFPPDPEQRIILDATFGVARDERGLWKSVATEIDLLACRQNLKTGSMKQISLGWLFVTGERLVVWSAHEANTAQESHNDLAELITNCDYLRKRTKRIYYGNGDESIELLSGARIIFRTRTKGGGRGLSGRKVILDEGFALKPMHMGALLPILSAQPDPQVVIGSSACLADSEVLQDVVKRGRSKKAVKVFYIEYCADPPEIACKLGKACTHERDIPGCGCDDPKQWKKANPQIGRRISEDTIRDERARLPVSEFCRERMGWHDVPAGGMSPIDLNLWGRIAAGSTQILDPVGLALDVRSDGLASSIAAVGRMGVELGGEFVVDSEGRLRGEIIANAPGTGWVVNDVVTIFETGAANVLVLDPSGPAGQFVPELLKRGFARPDANGRVAGDKWRLHLVSAREHAQACGALVTDISEDKWRHYDQPPLNAAVIGARGRPLADAWAWDRKDSTVDISPLVAVTLARLGYVLYPDGGTSQPWVISA